MILKDELTIAAGSLQTCAGQKGGSEAAIHAMGQIYASEDSEAVFYLLMQKMRLTV